jgi:hypothetical protein
MPTPNKTRHLRLGFPVVIGRIADPMFTDYFYELHPRFGFLQDPNNLFFCKPFLHSASR